MIMLSNEGHVSLLMIRKRWFRQWLGAVKQQTIAWANVYLDLCRHMLSLGRNGLRRQ